MTTLESIRYESLDQASTRIGIGKSTLRRWIKEGKITAYRPTSRVLRVREDEVDALMSAAAIDRFEDTEDPHQLTIFEGNK